jgi:Domain of unknown function (DUF4218)
MCDPMFLHYMYPFERAMGQLKGLVWSRSKPEGSIVVEKLNEDVIKYYTNYLEGVEPIGLPKYRYEGRLRGVWTKWSKFINLGLQWREKVHLKVLEHLAEVTPYVNDHMVELRE